MKNSFEQSLKQCSTFKTPMEGHSDFFISDTLQNLEGKENKNVYLLKFVRACLNFCLADAKF